MQHSLRETFSRLIFFFIPLVIFWVGAGMAWGLYGYKESFLFLNTQFHNTITDFAGLYLTHLADSVLLPLIILVWTWKKDRSLFFTSLILIASVGLFSQLLKHGLFSDWNRPPAMIEELKSVIILPQKAPRFHSFPSGHASIFGVGGVIFAWFFRDRAWWWQVGIGGVTILLAYTRVHLGVHFLGDILAGTFLGAVLGAVLLSLCYERIKEKYERKWKAKLDPYSRWMLAGAILLFIGRFVGLVLYSS